MNSICITLFQWSAEFTKISRDGAILICTFGMSTLMVQIQQHSLGPINIRYPQGSLFNKMAKHITI